MKPTERSLRRDARGAVFVEKLIVYLPLLTTFFVAWELAELCAASVVLQRASAAAGRAAMVVLPDDPAYYGGEPTDSYDGARRNDIELAAGMVLSAIPRFTSEFEVDVSDPPSGFGTIEVSVTAMYGCGAVSLLCGADGALELTSTTQHAYQGARYAYASPTGGLGSTSSALVASDEGARLRAKKGKGKGNGNGQGSQGGSQGDPDAMDCDEPGPKYDQCRPEHGLDKPGRPKPADNTPGPPDPYGTGYDKSTFADEDNISYEAIRYRCNHPKLGDDQNVSVVKYKCEDGRAGYFAAGSGKTGGTKGNHSEQNSYQQFKADKKYKGCTIEEFYTERESCSEKCQKWFDNGDPDIQDLKNRTTYTFLYNDKYDKFDPKKAKEPWIVELRNACTPFNELSRKPQSKGGVAGFGKTECARMQEWANKTDKIDGKDDRTAENMRKCLEYQQIRDDAVGQGIREQAQKDTAQAIRDAKKKLCGTLKGTKHPTWEDMDTE